MSPSNDKTKEPAYKALPEAPVDPSADDVVDAGDIAHLSSARLDKLERLDPTGKLFNGMPTTMNALKTAQGQVPKNGPPVKIAVAKDIKPAPEPIG